MTNDTNAVTASSYSLGRLPKHYKRYGK